MRTEKEIKLQREHIGQILYQLTRVTEEMEKRSPGTPSTLISMLLVSLSSLNWVLGKDFDKLVNKLMSAVEGFSRNLDGRGPILKQGLITEAEFLKMEEELGRTMKEITKESEKMSEEMWNDLQAEE